MGRAATVQGEKEDLLSYLFGVRSFLIQWFYYKKKKKETDIIGIASVTTHTLKVS